MINREVFSRQEPGLGRYPFVRENLANSSSFVERGKEILHVCWAIDCKNVGTLPTYGRGFELTALLRPRRAVNMLAIPSFTTHSQSTPNHIEANPIIGKASSKAVSDFQCRVGHSRLAINRSKKFPPFFFIDTSQRPFR